LHKTEIGAILAYLWPSLVAMAKPQNPVKFHMAYLNSPTPKPYFSRNKFLDFLHGTEISAIAILSYFCLNLVAMATPLAPLKL